MKKVAFMFPGQGSQVVGMGKDFYENNEVIRDMYAMADEVLNKELTNLIFEGPAEALTETENAQPALVLNSIAAYNLLVKENVKPVMVVGHSLGEYSALVAAQVLSLEEALPLVATRGRLMEEAYPKGKGSMAAVLGLTEEAITTALKEIAEGEIVEIANLNCPGQIVISGTRAGIEQAEVLLKDAGAKRVIPLNVSGPFHSRLMQPANDKFQEYLDSVTFRNAAIPVYANVTAKPETDKNEIKSLLVKQLYSPVRFEESVNRMLETDLDAIVEVGTGKVLSGLVRKISRPTKTFAVQDTASLEAFLAWYKGDEA